MNCFQVYYDSFATCRINLQTEICSTRRKSISSIWLINRSFGRLSTKVSVFGSYISQYLSKKRNSVVVSNYWWRRKKKFDSLCESSSLDFYLNNSHDSTRLKITLIEMNRGHSKFKRWRKRMMRRMLVCWHRSRINEESDLSSEIVRLSSESISDNDWFVSLLTQQW